MNWPGAGEMLELAHAAWFQATGIANVSAILAAAQTHAPIAVKKALTTALAGILQDLPIALEDCSLLAAALSCHNAEKTDLSTPDDPHALIACFARRHYYREAVHRMQGIVRQLGEKNGPARQTARIFCNSRLPEKLLSAFCGLGFYGKNSLLIIPGLGSRFIICLLLLPFRLREQGQGTRPAGPGLECGTCSACLQACPAGALIDPGRVDKKRCLQQLCTELVPWPNDLKKIWGFRLYGCDSCQDVCPYNAGLTRMTETACGVLGPGISLSRLLGPQEEFKAFFKKTALGLAWINPLALVRNAILAAGNRKNKIIIPLLDRFLLHENAVIRDAARWARQNILGPL